MTTFENIFDAAKNGCLDDVRYFIEVQGINVNAKDQHANTPLHYATGWNFKVDISSYLVSQGADVKAKNCVGNTPLYFASRVNSVDVLQILIAHGANVNAKCVDSEWKDWTPLHGAASNNPDIEVLKYLISQGADINAKTAGFLGFFGRTPLDVADTEEKRRILREAMAKK